MSILTKTVKIKWNSSNKEWYKNKGYIFTKIKEEFEVNIEDLSKGSHADILVKCDSCKNIKSIFYQTYLKCVKEDGLYFCTTCSNILFGKFKRKNTMLKNGTSLEQWCIENNRQDVLGRWDYELNDCNPSEINCGTHIKYYLKCPKGLHESELKSIKSLTSSTCLNLNCKKCNSFAQYLIDIYGENALKQYWDYEKNKNIDPWFIARNNRKQKIWIKCQEKDYHESYDIQTSDFIIGDRCPYCSNSSGKVHELDSLGSLFPDVLNIWSDKNKKSPFNYAPRSNKKIWWKCLEYKHKDYKRSINKSNGANFRCPECQFSQGEYKISQHLINKNIKYEFQKGYNGLLGLGGGNLSYDFYLPDYNLLIEYQGEFHDGNGNYYMKQNLEKQKEHDRRKREYADSHNINLLEIWYYDFDKIEEILELIILKYEEGMI